GATLAVARSKRAGASPAPTNYAQYMLSCINKFPNTFNPLPILTGKTASVNARMSLCTEN
ncbi:MAG: hypothetical protein KAX05_15950, partial [Bacteroidales bacterium]|nr:hypothetical protein [Bacteroidales bacterium]